MSATPDSPSTPDAAKLLRIGTMVSALLDEARRASIDDDGRRLMARIHNDAVHELGAALPDELRVELDDFNSCCAPDAVPSSGEIRLAQAQLLGWLQGVMNGLRVAAATAAATAPAPEAPTEPGAPPGGGLYL